MARQSADPAEPFVNRSVDVSEGAKHAQRDPELALTAPERSPDANKELAAAALEVGELGFASRQSVRDKQKPVLTTGVEGLHVVPIPGMTDGFVGHDAEQHVALQAQMSGEEEIKRAALEEETYLFYQRCAYGHHGLYYTKKPLIAQAVPDECWYAARIKPDPKQFYRGFIMCQVCAMSNKRTPLHVQMTDEGQFIPDTHFVWRVPKDRKRAMIEGDSRAFDDKFPGNNTWRTEHNKKLIDNGYVPV